jgi:hypothetical protein
MANAVIDLVKRKSAPAQLGPRPFHNFPYPNPHQQRQRSDGRFAVVSVDRLYTSKADVQTTGRIGCCGGIVLKNPIADRPDVLPLMAFVAVAEAWGASCGDDWRLNWDQLGQFP